MNMRHDTRSSPLRDGIETRYGGRMRRVVPILFLAPLLASCSSKESAPPGGTMDPPPPACALEGAVFEAGDPVGHADPLGAAAAKQARAGRIGDPGLVAQPAHGRQRIEAGDYLIINDKIAVVIENKGLSDGYARFGGEILAVDRVGADGKPMGLSLYGETLMGIGIRMIDPTSVTVLHDGEGGGEAVIRVTGPIQPIPFLNGPLRALFPRDYHYCSKLFCKRLRPGGRKSGGVGAGQPNLGRPPSPVSRLPSSSSSIVRVRVRDISLCSHDLLADPPETGSGARTRTRTRTADEGRKTRTADEGRESTQFARRFKRGATPPHAASVTPSGL
jgi:hypothetical protein